MAPKTPVIAYRRITKRGVIQRVRSHYRQINPHQRR